ncbi:hypothetical protein TNIN_487511 [Trichonephila inaurata madagascariensis]|uniref:PWWP domain-containing protein n=1 Tax=Trichonephila inaurata madagascariensis TaxID=2747483 RepID=A0A8X6Y1L8_9ARAC|nr:hypothetical protein TNIN_487511 [Trichonephila inaurata madagascariensis]
MADDSDSDVEETRKRTWNLTGVKPMGHPFPYEIVWAKMHGYPPWPAIKIQVQIHNSPSRVFLRLVSYGISTNACVTIGKNSLKQTALEFFPKS